MNGRHRAALLQPRGVVLQDLTVSARTIMVRRWGLVKMCVCVCVYAPDRCQRLMGLWRQVMLVAISAPDDLDCAALPQRTMQSGVPERPHSSTLLFMPRTFGQSLVLSGPRPWSP